MKKISYFISAATGIALSSQALATATHPNHTGFYLGLDGGYEIGKTKVKSSTNGKYDYRFTHNYPNIVRVFQGSGNIDGDYNRSSTSKGFTGGTHLGYQHQSNRFVIGGELSFSFSNAKRKQSNISGSSVQLALGTFNFGDETRIRHKRSMGAALKFGYLMSPTVVTGIKLGYAQDTYDFKSRQYLTNAAKTIEMSQKSKKFKVNSFVPGIYVEKLINNHWLIGAEYNYSVSKGKRLSTTSAMNTGVAPAINKASTSTDKQFKPSAHALKVRLGYKF